MLPTASNTTQIAFLTNTMHCLALTGVVVHSLVGVWGTLRSGGNTSMQPDISYPQQVLDHLYHPSRWVTFTRHAYVTPGSGVGPQVSKRALIATTVGGPLSLSMLYSVMASPPDDIQNRRWHRLTLPLCRGRFGLHVSSLSVPQVPPNTLLVSLRG